MTPPRFEFEGHVDRIENGWILGWAWDRLRPDEAVSVEVHENGQVVTTGTASLYRADLETAGKGNGRHAFELRVDDSAGVDRQLRVIFAGTTTELGGSPLRLSGERPAAGRTADRRQRGGARYRSQFGGLWTDLSNAPSVVDGKLALGWITAEEATRLRHWIDRGFVIIPGAVPLSLIEGLDAEVEAVWSGRSNKRLFVEYWRNDIKTIAPASPEFRDQRVKLLDLYSQSELARQIMFAEPIIRMLSLLFERPAVAFQSLYFRWGSRQEIHQDTAFVKVSSPMELVASWVALEDIQPGSGELEYYVGSHQLDDYLFEGTEKWMPFKSGEYEAFGASLHARSQAHGFERQRLLAKRGDVLLWSADLAHGGSQDAREGVTRKSLVTHYCPADCRPVYGGLDSPEERLRFSGTAFYSVPRRE